MVHYNIMVQIFENMKQDSFLSCNLKIQAQTRLACYNGHNNNLRPILVESRAASR
jgi:hypothetical protein